MYIANISYFCMMYNRCWLNADTKFVWAFIAPVVVIILVSFYNTEVKTLWSSWSVSACFTFYLFQCNIEFLIMALVIMYCHLKKQDAKAKVDTAK